MSAPGAARCQAALPDSGLASAARADSIRVEAAAKRTEALRLATESAKRADQLLSQSPQPDEALAQFRLAADHFAAAGNVRAFDSLTAAADRLALSIERGHRFPYVTFGLLVAVFGACLTTTVTGMRPHRTLVLSTPFLIILIVYATSALVSTVAALYAITASFLAGLSGVKLGQFILVRRQGREPQRARLVEALLETFREFEHGGWSRGTLVSLIRIFNRFSLDPTLALSSKDRLGARTEEFCSIVHPQLVGLSALLGVTQYDRRVGLKIGSVSGMLCSALTAATDTAKKDRPLDVRNVAKILKGLETLHADLTHVRQIIEQNPACSLVDTIRVVLDAKKSTLKEMGVEVTLQFSWERDDCVSISKSHLSNIIENLISNAVVAMRLSPKRRLVCRVSHEPAAVLLTVSDTGPGIPREQREGLFTERPEQIGHGFGLPYARKVLVSRGGNIWVGSDEPGASMKVLLRRWKPGGNAND
jgi:signal transduction histidine kinase